MTRAERASRDYHARLDRMAPRYRKAAKTLLRASLGADLDIHANSKAPCWAYVLECEDGRGAVYYTGISFNLVRRLGDHLLGHGSKLTTAARVKRVVKIEVCDSEAEAREVELFDLMLLRQRGKRAYGSVLSEPMDHARAVRRVSRFKIKRAA